jgi:hypothetical protein
MSECAVNKIDSNLTGLSFAEEMCLGELPATPVFYALEPNSYSKFGGDIKTVARAFINPSRQNYKGAVVDLTASGGINVDVTKTNLLRLMQGFFFADARQKPATNLLNSAPVVLTGVTGGNEITAAAGLAGLAVVGHILYASGFNNVANNGLLFVTGGSNTEVTVSNALTAETPPATASLINVGYEFASGDCEIMLNGAIPELASTSADFTTMNLIPGEWIFIGGDGAAFAFTNNGGYARIASISAHLLTFSDVTWTPVAEVGAGKTVQIFFGTVIKNETTPALIKRRSYTLERTLGMGETSTQAEYISGAVADQFTLNVKQATKLDADLTWVGINNYQLSGEVGYTILSSTATLVPAAGEDAYNTASNIYRTKMAIVDPTNPAPASLFGYVSDATVVIKNSVTALKAIGVLGAFDTTAGTFDVSGSVTAYFENVAAIAAIRNNASVEYNAIFASENAGFIFDMPLLTLGGGALDVKKDTPVSVPLTSNAAANTLGYTLLSNWFFYLPEVAMPN